MNSITQFWSDNTYRAIVSPNGRYVIKHSKEENYDGYDEIFLLYDSGQMIREIIGENCLFINNDYVLKFPFWGYSEECMELVLIKLADNTKFNIFYPKSIENILCSRVAIFHKEEMKVYFYSNVQTEIKDYTKFLYFMDMSKLINSFEVDVYESIIDFTPNNTFLEIFNNSLLCFDDNDRIIQLKLPLKNNTQLLNLINMKNFTINPNNSWYTDPITNTRQRGKFISRPINAFYHADYHGGNNELRVRVGTVENIITTLKNQFQDKHINVLMQAKNNLIQILKTDLPQILQRTRKNNLTVCVIPRAKLETYYSANQMFFKQAVIDAINQLNGFSDGTNYIIRHTNTRTTHLDRSGYGGDGDLPYPGITVNTCNISENVHGKDILLIDDLYTESVNIDEDAIQALLDNGAKNVYFYAVGKTIHKRPKFQSNDLDDLPF